MLKQKKKSPQSIVWTIDPFETKNAHRAPLAKVLKIFSKNLGQSVKPFSVASPISHSWPVPTPLPYPMGKDLQEFGIETVSRDLKKLHMRGMHPPTVEVHDTSSRRELVKDVLRFAKDQNAEYIAVNTQRLLSSFPFRVGGFAEALIGSSPLPVIAVSPKARVSNQIKRILFPSDFSRRSHQAFRKTLSLAVKFGAEIELLHVKMPLFVPFSFSEMAIGVHEDYMKTAELNRFKQTQRIAQRWCQEAKKVGVKCSYQSVSGEESVAPSILKAAKRHRSDLISMAGYRGSKTPVILGGTVRDVLSSAKIPVLEFRA